MQIPLKIAILQTGKSQRAISLAALIPETRLSDLVRGRSEPTPNERSALQRVLGRDYFELVDAESTAVSAGVAR